MDLVINLQTLFSYESYMFVVYMQIQIGELLPHQKWGKKKEFKDGLNQSTFLSFSFSFFFFCKSSRQYLFFALEKHWVVTFFEQVPERNFVCWEIKYL